jgi:hypothetical protein
MYMFRLEGNCMICFIFCTTKSCKVLHTNSRNTFSFQTKGGEKCCWEGDGCDMGGRTYHHPFTSQGGVNFMLTNVDGLSFVFKKLKSFPRIHSSTLGFYNLYNNN